MMGRLGDAGEAQRFSVEAVGQPCDTYDRCTAALMLAETMAQLDRPDEARELLDGVQESVAARRLAWKWRQVDALLAGTP